MSDSTSNPPGLPTASAPGDFFARVPTAVVTGAASGIGRAIAQRLSSLGYRLVLVDQNQAGLDAALPERGPSGRHTTVTMDVSDAKAWRHLVDERLPENDDIALLVQAAGVLLAGRLGDCPPEEIERLVRVNLTGVLLGAAAFEPRLTRGQTLPTSDPPLPRGVLNVASIFASVTPPAFAAYNASKAGVVAATETLRAEWVPQGLSATAVLPGVTRTGLFDAAAYADDRLRVVVTRRVGDAELTADRVADEAIEAYRRGKAVAPIGRRASRYHWLKRIVPGLLRRRVAAEANRELPR